MERGSSSGARGKTIVIKAADGMVARPEPLHFALIEELGHGGMGVVLRGRDPDLHREVAIKLLRGASDPVRRARFIAEAQITGQLEHPNIVPVHQFGLDPDGSPWFAMKIVNGETLAELLGRRVTQPEIARAWPLTRLVGVLIQVCNAVAFAHSRGVIHRDLKPANVMLGGFGEVVVMDWGLGKMLEGMSVELVSEPGALPTSPLMTLDGAVIGTPCYMAPEQARGEIDQLSVRSDVYALGATLCELIGGQPPVTGTSVDEVLALVGAGQIKLPLVDWQGRRSPRELLAVVRRALATEPDERYASAEALAEDLQRWLDLRAVSVSDSSLADQIRRFLGRHRIASIVAAIAAVALVVSVTVGFLAKEEQARHARQAQGMAETQRTRAEDALALAEQQRLRAEEQRAQADLQRRQAENGRRRAQVLATSAERQGRQIDRGFTLALLAQADAAVVHGQRLAAAHLLERIALNERDWCWGVLHAASVGAGVLRFPGDAGFLAATGSGFARIGTAGQLTLLAIDGTELRSVALGRPAVASAASGDGRLLAVALRGGSLCLIDAANGRTLANAVGGDEVRAVATSASDPLVLLAAGRSAVRMLFPGAAQPTIEQSLAEVSALVISPDAAWWAAACPTGVLLQPGTAVQPAAAADQPVLLEGSDGVSRLTMTSDGRRLIGAAQRMLRVWSMPQGTLLTSLAYEGTTDAAGLACNRDASLIATADGPHLTLWDVESGLPVMRLASGGSPFIGLCWSYDGTTLAGWCADGALLIWRPG